MDTPQRLDVAGITLSSALAIGGMSWISAGMDLELAGQPEGRYSITGRPSNNYPKLRFWLVFTSSPSYLCTCAVYSKYLGSRYLLK